MLPEKGDERVVAEFPLPHARDEPAGRTPDLKWLSNDWAGGWVD